jgi:hypothetical protein
VTGGDERMRRITGDAFNKSGCRVSIHPFRIAFKLHQERMPIRSLRRIQHSGVTFLSLIAPTLDQQNGFLRLQKPCKLRGTHRMMERPKINSFVRFFSSGPGLTLMSSASSRPFERGFKAPTSPRPVAQ